MERYAAMLAGTMEREREAGGNKGGSLTDLYSPPRDNRPANSGRARPAARFTPASASRRSSLGSVHGSAGATPARRPGSRDPGRAAAAAARHRAIEVEDEEEARISQRLGRVYLAGESRTRHANALVSKYAVNGRAGESMGDGSGRRGGAARAGSRGSPASILDTLRSDASDPYEAYESHSYSSHKPAGIGNFWEIRQGIAREFHSGH